MQQQASQQKELKVDLSKYVQIYRAPFLYLPGAPNSLNLPWLYDHYTNKIPLKLHYKGWNQLTDALVKKFGLLAGCKERKIYPECIKKQHCVSNGRTLLSHQAGDFTRKIAPFTKALWSRVEHASTFDSVVQKTINHCVL